MTCTDPTAKMFFVQWLFDGFQVVALICVGVLASWLWRLTRARDGE